MAKRKTSNMGSVRVATQANAPAAAVQPSGTPKVQLDHKQIAEHAYYIWLRMGRPQGQDLQIWKQAETELAAMG